MTHKKWVLRTGILLLFALLTLVYFRDAVFSGSGAFITRHLATDLYEPFMNAQEHLEWLRQGFVGLGDYWMNRGGGFPSVPLEQLVAPFNLLLMAVYTITGSFVDSLRVLMPLFYFATLITSYWFGTIILKRRDASVILAVAYTFSMYGVVQLEHIDLVAVQPLILLTLIFLEKVLDSPKRVRYAILTGVFLFSVYMTQLYPFYFTMAFIGGRVAFHLLTAPKRVETLKCVAKVGVLFLLLAVPFLLPQVSNVPPQHVQDQLSKNLVNMSQPPDLFFLRSTADVPIPEVGGPFYLGLVVVVLLLLPIILRKTNRTYVFYLLVLLTCGIYAMGSHSPLNLAGWVQDNMPLSFFLRAVIRSMVIGYLGLAVCAAVGFALLADRLKAHVPRLLLLLVVVLLVFCDLTVGYEPPAKSWVLTQNDAYEFLEEQEGDFRVVEIPSTYLQMATSSMHTNHDVLSGYAWGHGYFDPQYAFIDIYDKHLYREVTAQEAAFYGIKYVVINTDPQYYNELHRELKYYNNPKRWKVLRVADYFDNIEGYELVYDRDGYAIYENLLYRGTVFSDEAILQYVREDPNTIVIDVQSHVPASIYISQGYNEGWVAKVEGGNTLRLTEVDSIQRMDVPAGTYRVILHYQRYERFFWWLVPFYTVFVVMVIWLLRHEQRNVK